MAAYILLIVMAAFGGLCILWALFGFLLPARRGAAMVCHCKEGTSEELLIRRYLWLYSTGLIRCPLILVDCGLPQQVHKHLKHRGYPIMLCAPEELQSILEQEREYLG